MPEPVQLADFDNPPVVETVLSLQFDKLTAMQTVHLGLLWRQLKDRFPKTEERPALPQVFERFPEPLGRGANLQFEATEIPEMPRLWLLNSEGTEMIQVQRDRFIKNWRKAGDKDQYPRYEPVIKPAFKRDFQDFQIFLAEENLGTVNVNQCEVTYVNHIMSGHGWKTFDELHQIFKFWQPTAMPIPGPADDCRIHTRFTITDNQRPIGRLHVDIQPAFRAADNHPMYVMNLTARGMCGTDFEFFDIGREWIVRSFEQLTTDQLHEIWRKK